MNISASTFSPILGGTKSPNFIHLKDITFAEYNFVYRINDGYSVKHLSKFNDKHQLLFQKVSGKAKQMNLMIVDSIFPILLADVVLDTFLNNVSSFSQYSTSKNKIVINDTEFNREYLEYKFKYFIHYLLFSNIASDEACKGNIETDKIYYQKGQSRKLQYFSIFEQKELQDLMFQKLTLKINPDKSFITKDEASICLALLFK
jgi:hypothetical protein